MKLNHGKMRISMPIRDTIKYTRIQGYSMNQSDSQNVQAEECDVAKMSADELEDRIEDLTNQVYKHFNTSYSGVVKMRGMDATVVGKFLDTVTENEVLIIEVLRRTCRGDYFVREFAGAPNTGRFA